MPVVREPSATLVVLKKLLVSLLCAGLFLTCTPYFPISRVKGKTFDCFLYVTHYPTNLTFYFSDDEFIEETTIFGKMFFIVVATTIARMKYYHAWLLSDAICNASGLGFNGYDAEGRPKWDLISNVDIINFEVNRCISQGKPFPLNAVHVAVWSQPQGQYRQLEQIHQSLVALHCLRADNQIPHCPNVLPVGHMARFLSWLLHNVPWWSVVHGGFPGCPTLDPPILFG